MHKSTESASFLTDWMWKPAGVNNVEDIQTPAKSCFSIQMISVMKLLIMAISFHNQQLLIKLSYDSFDWQNGCTALPQKLYREFLLFNKTHVWTWVSFSTHNTRRMTRSHAELKSRPRRRWKRSCSHPDVYKKETPIRIGRQMRFYTWQHFLWERPEAKGRGSSPAAGPQLG